MASEWAIPAAFSLVCSSCAADLSAAGPTRTRYILFLPLVMGDTDALKPFTRAWSTSRSAFSLLPKTPSCTPQPPDSPLAVAGFSAAAACGLAAGFSAAAGAGCGLTAGVSAAAVRAGLAASARAAAAGVGWLLTFGGGTAATGLAGSARAAVAWLLTFGADVGGEVAGLVATAGDRDVAVGAAVDPCAGCCSWAGDDELPAVADEGAGDVGRALDADDPALLFGELADGLAPAALDCWSVGAALSHVVDSFAPSSGVVVGCA